MKDYYKFLCTDVFLEHLDPINWCRKLQGDVKWADNFKMENGTDSQVILAGDWCGELRIPLAFLLASVTNIPYIWRYYVFKP